MMRYAEVAINTPVDHTFHYHIPPELDERLEIGHLVRVAFRTAMQPAIVVGFSDSSPVDYSKPILETLDPVPVVNAAQIVLARWLSERYLTPLGACLWTMLPPGMVGHHDVRVRLIQSEAAGDNPLEAKLIEALRGRKKAMRGGHLSKAVGHKRWQGALKRLQAMGVVHVESILTPPRVRPKKIQVVALAIPTDHLVDYRQHLGKRSRAADALQLIVTENLDSAQAVLDLPGIGPATLNTLVDSGYVRVDDDILTPLIDMDALDDVLFALREGALDWHVLQVLSREDDPVDVSWVYAQTGAKLADLKALESKGLVWLGEARSIRDSLRDMDFVPATAPRLSSAQMAAWLQVRAGLVGNSTLPLNPPRRRGGESDERDSDSAPSGIDTPHAHEEDVVLADVSILEQSESWQSSPKLWEKLMPLAQEHRQQPTQAEKTLWRYLRDEQIEGVKFRRQHAIERFIVDFYCRSLKLIVEIDGGYHENTQDQDVARQRILEYLGYTVLRFDNDQVMSQPEKVRDAIAKTVRERLQTLERLKPTIKPDSPPSVYGEGLELGSISATHTYLLHGVTGSGKTEIYLRAMGFVLAQGRQAIFMVPEIALTAQTVRRVMARFPGRVALVHSGLSEGERFDTWQRARAGEFDVIVGTRTALFTPLPDIGLIILDEAHDPSYKQSPPTSPPYYHARDVAIRMMQQQDGVVILGSATPSVESYYRAQRGIYTYLSLPQRIMGHRKRITGQAQQQGVSAQYVAEDDSDDAVHIDLPPVTVVDMREELKRGNTGMFSTALYESLVGVLERGEQAILYLNRRGTSTYVFCRDCGYVAACPRCDTPMTFHMHGEVLRCHHCDYQQVAPVTCPECQSRRIKFFGAGTQHIESTLRDLFPNAVSLRWDADTAAKPSEHDVILQRFSQQSAQILIGTQMIAKGLDLPLVTLVGVVGADMGLNLPDYAAGERVFQLLTQVSGRAGRGLLGGQVILQTYQPEHYVIQMAAQHDYEGFYTREIDYRYEMGYPPFRRLVRVVLQHEQEHKARDEAHRAADTLFHRINSMPYTATEIIGPVPCFFSRVNRLYRWQVILRGPQPHKVLRYGDFGRGWVVDIDPVDIL